MGGAFEQRDWTFLGVKLDLIMHYSEIKKKSSLLCIVGTFDCFDL